MSTLFDMMVGKFKYCNALICVGLASDGNLLVYVRKQDCRKIPDLHIEHLGYGTTYAFLRGGRAPYSNDSPKALRLFYGCLTHLMTNMIVTGPEDEHNEVVRASCVHSATVE